MRVSCATRGPDVLPVLHKLQKGTAGLAEFFKLYLFSRAIASVSATRPNVEVASCARPSTVRKAATNVSCGIPAWSIEPRGVASGCAS